MLFEKMEDCKSWKRMKDVWLTFSRLDRTISVMGLCFSLCLSTSICMWAISLAWAKAIRASVCNLACLAKKSASSIGAEFEPVSSLRGGRLSTWGLIGICCFCGCFELSEVGVDPGDESVSEHGDSVSEGVSFMKQIWRFIPERKEWSSLMITKDDNRLKTVARFNKKNSCCNCIKSRSIINNQDQIRKRKKKKKIQIYFAALSEWKKIKKDEQYKNIQSHNDQSPFVSTPRNNRRFHGTLHNNLQSLFNTEPIRMERFLEKRKSSIYKSKLKKTLTRFVVTSFSQQYRYPQ